MADVIPRCRRLGFPVLISTDKSIGDMDAKTVLWLFYYLLEIYEPSWSRAPTRFTSAHYKPLTNAMRLLELGHKCPKPKELKAAAVHKRSLISSLGAVLDKLEAKYPKLYSRRFQHPSVSGMQQIRDSRTASKPDPKPPSKSSTDSKESKPSNPSNPTNPMNPTNSSHSNHRGDSNSSDTVNTIKQSAYSPAHQGPAQSARPKLVHSNRLEERRMPRRGIPPPRATSKDLNSSYESKSEEVENVEMAMDGDGDGDEDGDDNQQNLHSMDIDNGGVQRDVERQSMGSYPVQSQATRSMHKMQRSPPRTRQNAAPHRSANMNGYSNKTQSTGGSMDCDLKAYNFKAPKYQNETVRFHVKMQEKGGQTMTERYETLKRKESEKAERIGQMKQRYEAVASQLMKQYSFRAKPFQKTSSTDYAVFQLESIQQKLESENAIKREKSVELMEEDGVDHLLNSLSHQVQNWTNHSHS